jgi:hypothetical protein
MPVNYKISVRERKAYNGVDILDFMEGYTSNASATKYPKKQEYLKNKRVEQIRKKKKKKFKTREERAEYNMSRQDEGLAKWKKKIDKRMGKRKPFEIWEYKKKTKII